MILSMQIICLICITSCSGLPFFSFFGSSSAPEKKTVDDLGFEKFDEFESEDILQDEPAEIHQKTDTHAESASSVLGQMKSMLQSSPDSTKQYIAKKAEELTYLLKNDIRNIVEFTFNKNQMLVDLGPKNSRIRAVNLQEAHGLVDYIFKQISRFFSWINYLIFGDEEKTPEENKDKEKDKNDANSDDKENDKADHQDNTSIQTGAPRLEDLHNYEKVKDHSTGIDDTEKNKNSQTSQRETELDDDKEKTKTKDQQDKSSVLEQKIVTMGGKQYVCTGDTCVPLEVFNRKKKEQESKDAAKPPRIITDFEPFKNLSPEEKEKIKKDVDVANQEIADLEKAIQEIRNKPSVDHDKEEEIKELNDRITLKKEFIRISTS